MKKAVVKRQTFTALHKSFDKKSLREGNLKLNQQFALSYLSCYAYHEAAAMKTQEIT